MSPYYLIDLDENLRFTSYGLSELRPYFAKAGIDIRKIKTYADYIEARRRASPYFMDWIEERTRTWPQTEEFQLLKYTILQRPGY